MLMRIHHTATGSCRGPIDKVGPELLTQRWYRCAVPRLGPAKRESGEVLRIPRRVDPGTAPATVSGEPFSTMPLRREPREGGGKQRPASQETCLRQSPFRCTGRALGAALRSGDVLKPSRGIRVGRFSQIHNGAQRSRPRDMVNPHGGMSCPTTPSHAHSRPASRPAH